MVTINWTGYRQKSNKYRLIGEWFVDEVLRGPIESPADLDLELITPEADIIAMLENMVALEQYGNS